MGSTPEEKVRRAAKLGEFAIFTPGETIPASLIVELACCAEGDSSVHAKGVRIKDATIVGKLDFEDRTLTRPLILVGCAIAAGICLDRSRAAVLSFADCPEIGGIEANRLVTEANLFLRGSKVTGRVSLVGARIDGNLECDGAKLDGKDGNALDGDGLQVTGALFLRGGFSATGQLNFAHAQVGILADNEECWPKIKGGHDLAGFTYGSIFAGALLDSAARADCQGARPQTLSLLVQAGWQLGVG